MNFVIEGQTMLKARPVKSEQQIQVQIWSECPSRLNKMNNEEAYLATEQTRAVWGRVKGRSESQPLASIGC